MSLVSTFCAESFIGLEFTFLGSDFAGGFGREGIG
jgi:hypothetical protein